ncbi:GNAT family N-acetyltransferase [Patescibacteria group bacterium]|nr:GNAT family N-acetyltransferase [Patescibacteria group bacterium]
MQIKIKKADQRHRKEINRLIMEALGSRIKGPIKDIWFIRVKGEIVATGGLNFYQDQVAIFTHLVVKKEFRRQGLGSALIRHRMQVAEERGVSILALITMYYHYNFYKRRGFKTCPRKELPESIKNHWMFTVQRYKKCAVMYQHI